MGGEPYFLRCVAKRMSGPPTCIRSATWVFRGRGETGLTYIEECHHDPICHYGQLDGLNRPADNTAVHHSVYIPSKGKQSCCPVNESLRL